MSSNEPTLFPIVEETPAPAVQRLVASYIESYSVKTGHRPPARVLGQVSRQLKMLIAEGRSASTLEEAVDSMVHKGLSPTLLPQLVAEEEMRQSTREARDYVEANGWPTGWKFKRSHSSGVYKRDVLGHDWPPGEKPITPSLDEIQETLEYRGEAY